LCVNERRSGVFDRAAFFGVIAAVAAPLALGPEAVSEAANVQYPLPLPTGPLTAGNAHAMRLAQRSPYARTLYSNVEALARTITDADLQRSVLGFLHHPAPDYAANAPTPEKRNAVRDALVAAGFMKASDPLSAIFPPGTEPNSSTVLQPFWSTPGSFEGSHHAYPGGLATHEYFNASMSAAFASNYDAHYFGGRPNVDRDVVVGAALYHDIMKTAVFQWNDDGTLFNETLIGNTGAHHVLSGAQAIVHGRTPQFVSTLLSAHDVLPPATDWNAAVVDWCRASALIAGIDPVAFGLLKRDGSSFKLAAEPVPIEAFISNLSDHDYVLMSTAMHVVSDHLKTRYASWQPPTTFDWYRAAVLSQSSAMSLYDALTRRGESVFTTALQKVEANLDFT